MVKEDTLYDIYLLETTDTYFVAVYLVSPGKYPMSS